MAAQPVEPRVAEVTLTLEVDQGLRLMEANGAAMRVWGLGGDALGRCIDEIPALSEMLGLRGALRHVLRHGSAVSVDLTERGLGGRLRRRHRVVPVRDAGGAVVAARVRATALTEHRRRLEEAREQRQAEARRELDQARALREAEARARALLEAAPDGILVVDAEGRIILASERAAEMFGATREELARLTVEDLVPSDARARHAAHRAGFHAQPSVRLMHTRDVLWARRLDGSVFPAEIGLRPVLDGEAPCVVAVVRDVSERLRRDRLVQRARRTEVLTRLAGGIAHEYNNAITTILGYGDLLLQRIPPGGPERPLLERVVASAERIARLTEELVRFGGLHVAEPDVHDLVSLVRSAAPGVREQVGAGVAVAVDAAPGPLHIELDEDSLEIVLANLAANAAHAMGGRGALRLTVRAAAEDEAVALGVAGAGPWGPGWAVLEVADTGAGMDADTLERALEPFFTTRPVGEGTGLGLATVDGLVRQAGGLLHLESAPGAGTTVRILLPRVAPRERP